VSRSWEWEWEWDGFRETDALRVKWKLLACQCARTNEISSVLVLHLRRFNNNQNSVFYPSDIKMASKDPLVWIDCEVKTNGYGHWSLSNKLR
jgi:hypothetical protein